MAFKRQLIGVTLSILVLVALGSFMYAFLATPFSSAVVAVPFDTRNHFPIARKTVNGLEYTVDARSAIFHLEVCPEDQPSQKVFSNYADTIQYARNQGLPTIPSVSLVLAACRNSDDRLQMALARHLDEAPEDGMQVLLQRWLAEVEKVKGVLSPTNDNAQAIATYTIHSLADIYLSAAITLGGGTISNTVVTICGADDSLQVLGPWALDPVLTKIYRRDRHMAAGLSITDNESAAVAAVLARCMTKTPELVAGWKLQAAVARALAGTPSGVTFDELSPKLAKISDKEIMGEQAIAIVREAIGKPLDLENPRPVAPAAVSWVLSPEEKFLTALGMAAWDDPIGSLVKGIRSSRISLEPKPGDGLYHRRLYALESLAVPLKAPEHLKLQLSSAYAQRWQRAFTAGYTEIRSSFLKRLPEICLGSSADEDGPNVDISPQFTVEPAPLVYLRLARAYRALTKDMEEALGKARWQGLRDPRGESLAKDVERRALFLFGLALHVYQELGFPAPLLPEEKLINSQAAMQAARDWCATIEKNHETQVDARTLVTMANDGKGSHRCPAIIGIRLEPVKYDWVENPDVTGNITPHFVPSRYWLASPCPITITYQNVPDIVRFRQCCATQDNVNALYSSFGQRPPQLHPSAYWPWVRWMFVIIAFTVFLFGLRVVWRSVK